MTTFCIMYYFKVISNLQNGCKNNTRNFCNPAPYSLFPFCPICMHTLSAWACAHTHNFWTIWESWRHFPLLPPSTPKYLSKKNENVHTQKGMNKNIHSHQKLKAIQHLLIGEGISKLWYLQTLENYPEGKNTWNHRWTLDIIISER